MGDKNNVLANRLKEIRKNKKLSQLDVSKKTGINNKTLSGYENSISEPDIITLTILADFYDVPVDYLIGKVDEPIICNLSNDYLQTLPDDHLLNPNYKKNWNIIGFTMHKATSNHSTYSVMHISRLHIQIPLPNLNQQYWKHACIIARSFLDTLQENDSNITHLLLECDGQIALRVSNNKIDYYFPVELTID